MKENDSQYPHIVIVGAGFGGLKVAKALKKSRAKITIIDRKNHHLFQPLLYQVATAGLSPANIAAPIRGILRNQKNTEVILGEVHGVDTSKRLVHLDDKSISYDYLVLATGAYHSYFGHEEWSRFAPGLNSIEDATSIRRKILSAFESSENESDENRKKALLTFVIVGAGPTGVELAGSIAELAHVALASDFRHIDPKSARILLIEAGPRVLSAFPEDFSEKALHSLKKLGVEVWLHSRVENVSDNNVIISGKTIPTHTVIWAAGVVSSPAGRWLNVPTDSTGRVLVNVDLSVTDHSDVFVIGDAACFKLSNGKALPGLAPVAMQQGNLATIGRSSAVAEIKKLHLSGFLAWVTWLVVHIFYLIGFRNRILVLIEWAWAYFTFQRGARLITHEEKQ